MRRWLLFLAAVAAVVMLSAVAARLVAPRTVAAAEPAATPWPLRRHVRVQAYYGLNGVNADIAPDWMAEHVDIVEDDGFTAAHAAAFKAAGGALAFAYTDPTFVPHCSAPFTPPAGRCEGPIGNLVARDERAWVHDAHGARIHHFVSAQFGYQEMLDVGSSAARSAYARTTAAILAHAPRLDGFEADDSGGAFTVAGGPLGNNYYSSFGPGAAFTDDAAWIAGERGMLAAAGRPVIVNGSGGDWQPAYGGAFIDLPYVLGAQFEGCFNNEGGYRYSDRDDTFRKAANGILAVQAHGKLAVCLPTGDTQPAHRLYAYAAWLLVYDPRTSVYEMNVPTGDGHAIYPETQIVPLQPLATARTVDDLRVGGAYVREFSRCAIDGVPIAACAAVVNASSTSTVHLPPLHRRYAAHIALDAASLYADGRARIAAGEPAELAPTTAALLFAAP